jgi:hypothetical protein
MGCQLRRKTLARKESCTHRSHVVALPQTVCSVNGIDSFHPQVDHAVSRDRTPRLPGVKSITRPAGIVRRVSKFFLPRTICARCGTTA